MKRLFAFDIDGTLLTSSKHNYKILDSSKEAIKKIMSHGDFAVINTGRSLEMAKSIADEAGIRDIIAGNGSLYYNLDEKIKYFANDFIKSEMLEKVARTITINDGYSLIAQTFTKLVVYGHDDKKWLDEANQAHGDANFSYHSLGKQGLDSFLTELKADGKVLKMSAHPMNAELALVALNHVLANIDFTGHARFRTTNNFCEFGPDGYTKWRGIEEFAKHYSISPEAIYTFGDDANDLEMIKNATHGVAMGNAVEALKAVAHYITDSNDEHGIANVVDMVYDGIEI